MVGHLRLDLVESAARTAVGHRHRVLHELARTHRVGRSSDHSLGAAVGQHRRRRVGPCKTAPGGGLAQVRYGRQHAAIGHLRIDRHHHLPLPRRTRSQRAHVPLHLGAHERAAITGRHEAGPRWQRHRQHRCGRTRPAGVAIAQRVAQCAARGHRARRVGHAQRQIGR